MYYVEFDGVCQLRFELVKSPLMLLGPLDLMWEWDPIFRQFSQGFGRLRKIPDVRPEVGKDG